MVYVISFVVVCVVVVWLGSIIAEVVDEHTSQVGEIHPLAEAVKIENEIETDLVIWTLAHHMGGVNKHTLGIAQRMLK